MVTFLKLPQQFLKGLASTHLTQFLITWYNFPLAVLQLHLVDTERFSIQKTEKTTHLKTEKKTP